MAFFRFALRPAAQRAAAVALVFGLMGAAHAATDGGASPLATSDVGANHAQAASAPGTVAGAATASGAAASMPKGTLPQVPTGTVSLGGITAPGNAAPSAEARLIEQGRIIAVASDCMACHTAVTSADHANGGNGKPFAGGYPIESPMGTIYSTNITPSKSAGIGHYSEADFAAALREGKRADGARLYPAMPYTSYTQMTDADVHALYTYFMKGVAPVDTPAPTTQLPFPFSLRISMAFWNMLYLHDARFQTDSSKSAEWNRGAYLTTVLGHCDACHTPRNTLMAEDNDRAFGGAQLGAWYAPNISSDPVSGIGAWSDTEIVQYLKTGHVDGKNQAAGGMAEAVQNSLQFLSQDDLHAIATYLKSTTPIRSTGETVATFALGASDAGVEAEAGWRGMVGSESNQPLPSGYALYSGNCASCHGVHGEGSKAIPGINGSVQAYPSLTHNTATGAGNASNLVATILYGVDRKVGDNHVLMPSFGRGSYVAQLNNQQVADISNYVLTTFGNAKDHVSAEDVAVARAGGPRPLLAIVQPYIVPGIAIAVVIIVLLLGIVFARRRKTA
jgi:mono/diheme cytochrome c family protein